MIAALALALLHGPAPVAQKGDQAIPAPMKPPANAGTVTSRAMLWHDFLTPPDDARPMVRWWWFGPSVDDRELDREIAAMKAGGFGGFEVQPTYPLALDGELPGVTNAPYLSPRFLRALAHAGGTARASGMRIDVTLGSGWPFGGPHIPITQASSRVEQHAVPVPAGATVVPLPALQPGERRLAGFVDGRRIALTRSDTVTLPPAAGARSLSLYTAARTGQQVKRPSVGAEGYVLDHLDPVAIANHLTTVGDQLLSAFPASAPPYAMFSDSLEAYGASWTGDLPEQFRRRRGYDLLDYLPALFDDSQAGSGVRFDWALTLSELVNERYFAPINAWTVRNGTRFRAQAYGIPAPSLASSALVGLPEGEGDDWRSFTSTRWATSAAHLYAKPVVSSEVWTWLHSPAWAATPLDMKVEADRHFLQGINQLVGHGWPYSPPGAREPGWSFYAAAALNDHNPWYSVMPDVTRYLQRVSAMLRQGQPANAVAIYLPVEDAFAAMRPAAASVNDVMHKHVPDTLIAQVLDSGNGFDFVDAAAVRAGKLTHRVLILPPLARIDAESYATIARWVAKGGTLVALGALPSESGGLHADRERNAVQALSRRLATTASTSLRQALAATADVRLSHPDPAFGFVRRHLADGDLYFIANTGNVRLQTAARFAGDRGNGEWWNPMTGERSRAGRDVIALDLAPYETRILTFAGVPDGAGAPPQPAEPRSAVVQLLDGGWTLDIAGPLDSLGSWTDRPDLRTFSGTGTYRRTIAGGGCVVLDFGAAEPVTPTPGARPFAAVSAPVRDAAIVRVNGVRAGSVWAPPYRLDLTRWLKPGPNTLEVQVSNTAINALSGRPRIDYRLLTARYGERFQAQDLDRIVPQPSGLVRPATVARTTVGAACDPRR